MAKITIEGSDLVIRAPLNSAGRLSSSGKSMVLDTSNGFSKITTPFGMASYSFNIITSDDTWQGGQNAAARGAANKPGLARGNGNGGNSPAAAAGPNPTPHV